MPTAVYDDSEYYAKKLLDALDNETDPRRRMELTREALRRQYVNAVSDARWSSAR